MLRALIARGLMGVNLHALHNLNFYFFHTSSIALIFFRTILHNSSPPSHPSGNPLECGCDMKWVLGYPMLLSGHCLDGSALSDLSEADFPVDCGNDLKSLIFRFMHAVFSIWDP